MSGDNSLKVYVPVLAAFREDGAILPRKIRWEDGQTFDIERVIDIRPAAAQKSGGQGDRYTVQINGKTSYLFFERSPNLCGANLGKWFVERQ